MQKEVQAIESHGTWCRVSKSSLLSDTKVVPLMLAFRIKRKEDGDFNKFKACLVVRGDLKHGERESFSPIGPQLGQCWLLCSRTN